MNGLNYHDEMVKNMMNATYQGNTIIPKEIPVKIFTQEALEEHDKQIREEVIEKYKNTLLGALVPKTSTYQTYLTIDQYRQIVGVIAEELKEQTNG